MYRLTTEGNKKKETHIQFEDLEVQGTPVIPSGKVRT